MSKVLIMLLMISGSVLAQSAFKRDLLPSVMIRPAAAQSESNLTGVLSHDLFAVPGDSVQPDSISKVETRSALKAGLFSLVIPGAGQAYNGSYWKAAGFLAIEIAGWVVNAMWNSKGNNQTSYFEGYADGTAANSYSNGHYNVMRYAEWIQKNASQLAQITGSSDPATVNQYAQLIIVNDGPAPWNKVNWTALNKVESALGGLFSHLLPPHGDQQYYELIGKYPQFREGWYDQATPSLTVNGNLVTNAQLYDQLRYDTPTSGYYMDQRGLANHYYSIALTAVNIIIANHFLSAIEAAISAHSINKSVETSVGMMELPQGLGYQPEMRVKIHF